MLLLGFILSYIYCWLMQCCLQLCNSLMSCCQGRCVYGLGGLYNNRRGWQYLHRTFITGSLAGSWCYGLKLKNKNTSDYFTILTKECLKKYGQQYLPVSEAGDDGTLLSNNRTRARGGSRFFRDFFPGWSWPAKHTLNCILFQSTLPC